MWNKGGLDQDLDKWGEGVKSGIHSGDRDNQTQQKIERVCWAQETRNQGRLLALGFEQLGGAICWRRECSGSRRGSSFVTTLGLRR